MNLLIYLCSHFRVGTQIRTTSPFLERAGWLVIKVMSNNFHVYLITQTSLYYLFFAGDTRRWKRAPLQYADSSFCISKEKSDIWWGRYLFSKAAQNRGKHAERGKVQMQYPSPEVVPSSMSKHGNKMRKMIWESQALCRRQK